MANGTAAQIARRLHRPRYAVTAKATRLIRDGALRDVAKHFEVNPWPNRARPVHRTMPAKPTPPPVNNTLEPRPCTLIELDDGRCHWPLGDIEAVAVLFCGGVAVPGRCYCAHHLGLRVARAAPRNDRCDRPTMPLDSNNATNC